MPWALPKDQKSAAVAERALEGWKLRMAVLDRRLAGRDFLMGDALTLVDCAVAMIVGLGVLYAKLPIDDFRHVGAWLARCEQRPAFLKVVSEQ